jgi:hypothetical protein
MRVLKAIALGVVFALAFFGALVIAFNFLNEKQGRAVGPFVSGITSVVAEHMKKDLEETPDQKLEENARALSRKLYPVMKGVLLGQAEQFINDPKRSEVRKTMSEAGKAFSETVLAPFAEGVSQGSANAAGQVDTGLNKIRELGEKHKDIIESLTSGLKALEEFAEKHSLPRPPSRGSQPGPRDMSPDRSQPQ